MLIYLTIIEFSDIAHVERLTSKIDDKELF